MCVQGGSSPGEPGLSCLRFFYCYTLTKLGSWARWWNLPGESQPNPVSPGDEPPRCGSSFPSFCFKRFNSPAPRPVHCSCSCSPSLFPILLFVPLCKRYSRKIACSYCRGRRRALAVEAWAHGLPPLLSIHGAHVMLTMYALYSRAGSMREEHPICFRTCVIDLMGTPFFVACLPPTSTQEKLALPPPSLFYLRYGVFFRFCDYL